MSPLVGRLGLAMRPKIEAPKKSAQLDEPPSVVAELQQCILDDQKMLETPFFRPSGIGGCMREGYYTYLKARKDAQHLEPRVQLIFDMGSAIHEVVQKWFSRSHRFFVAPEVHVWIPKLEVFGHVDIVLIQRESLYRFMVEVKSINNDGFNRIAKPKQDHVDQANLYAGLLGFPWFTILYFNKDNQATREFKCRFNKNNFNESLEWCGEIKRHFLKKTVPPYDARACDEQKCAFVSLCKKAGRK